MEAGGEGTLFARRGMEAVGGGIEACSMASVGLGLTDTLKQERQTTQTIAKSDRQSASCGSLFQHWLGLSVSFAFRVAEAECWLLSMRLEGPCPQS